MSNFNSADIAAFKDVWVFCEQREGKLMPTDLELISKGRDLANELGVDLCGLLLGGEGIAEAAAELGGYGADKVIVCESPLLEVYNTDAYTKVICDVVEELKPEAFLIGATNIGRDLAPRCAARLHTGLCADCTHLDIDVANYIQFLRESSTLDVDSMKWDMEDRNLKMTRPAFGGHLMASIICPRFRPAMATVRPGVMKKAEPNYDRKAEVVNAVIIALEQAELPNLEALRDNNAGSSIKIQEQLLKNLEEEMKGYREQEETQYELLETRKYTQELFDKRNAALRQKMSECEARIKKARQAIPNAINYEEKVIQLKEAIQALKDDSLSPAEQNRRLKVIVDKMYISTTDAGWNKTDIYLQIFLNI